MSFTLVIMRNSTVLRPIRLTYFSNLNQLVLNLFVCYLGCIRPPNNLGAFFGLQQSAVCLFVTH